MVEIVLSGLLPVEAHPTDAFLDGVDIFLVFLHRIRIVKAHVAHALIVGSKTEVKANALGMTDVQIAVGLRRKTVLPLANCSEYGAGWPHQ